ncbi:MAG: exopolysaccharide biosynthesis polyprenyl glycosylphosphotransferase [Coriobacteriia bacterium]|nr:exopolysaccharide biosynthesis polyprenyl glycosylphosphotransferase [Coriobacteriia bacterium]
MISKRASTALGLAALDAATAVLAGFAAFALRNNPGVKWFDLSGPISADWSLAVFAVAVVVSGRLLGLYEREVFVSRPLHLWTIMRSTGLSFVLSALGVYLLKTSGVEQSRIIAGITFVLFLVLDSVLRLTILDHGFRASLRNRAADRVGVVGNSIYADELVSKLAELRGFARVERLTGLDVQRNLFGEMGVASAAAAPGFGDFCCVFLDAPSVPPQHVFGVIEWANRMGADCFVVSPLLRGLEVTPILAELFQQPVARVRRSLESVRAHMFKRAFDIVGSLAGIILLSPVILAAALAVRLSSPGPVLFRQERVGRDGQTFWFLKLRSMRVDNDDAVHREFVTSHIKGARTDAQESEESELLKLEVDDRITPVGRFIRKFSLDELPQFFNVLLGDMSLVGPRPALPYEVDVYETWHCQRMMVTPGLTGMWQVAGRSTVSFDEMIFQDLMYAKNQSLMVDVMLCLKTIPAVLVGRGAA